MTEEAGRQAGQTWRAQSGAGRLNLREWVQYVPFSLNASLFPSLVSESLPMMHVAWRDVRKPISERGNEELQFQRNKTSFDVH